MVYVQHLLGIGHLRRTTLLCNALARHGFEVDLISGGMPISLSIDLGVRLHQLPPVRCLDGHFERLIDENNQPVDEGWKKNRSDRLLELFNRRIPDALITESFPFARRMMRFELMPLLQRAREHPQPPIIVSSIRDILQPKSKTGRDEEIHRLVDCYYDRILVHGDPNFAVLSDTFSLADEISDKTVYSGYISEPQQNAAVNANGINEVLVSGGGGAASLPLLECALVARSLSTMKDNTWRLLAGPNINQPDFEQLKQCVDKGIIVERNRTDFSMMLHRCAVSVSQAGYNTAVDILKSGARAVMVPFAEAGEVEQTIRAAKLQEKNRVVALAQHDLTSDSLAAAIDHAVNMGLPELDIKTDGAESSAQLLNEWLESR